MGKKVISNILFVFCLLSFNFLRAEEIQTKQIFFSSPISYFVVNDNASLEIGHPISNWGGTLIKKENATISGQTITFQNGIFDNSDSKIYLQGTFDPTGNDIVRLTGNGYLVAEPGMIVERVEISGTSNKLRGQPLFNNPIQFLNSSATLNIALQSSLNQNINLNGGAIYLDNDLTLNDGVKIVGPGTVNMNGKKISLGEDKTISWTTNLNWNNAQDIVLSSSLLLDETWCFSGVGTINGNGNKLSFGDSGKLQISDDAILFLVDIILDDVKNGSLEFLSSDAQIRLINTSIQLAETTTLDMGHIYVEGESVVVLGPLDWIIRDNAKLTVDGVSLWVDTLDITNTLEFGQIKAPVNTLDPDGDQPTCIAAGNLELVNHGVIRRIISGGSFGSGGEGCTGCRTEVIEELIWGSGTNSLVLDQGVDLHLYETIEVNDDITIDGNGALIFFSNQNDPQLIIAPGKTLTLKNITLTRIRNNSFDIPPSARLNIGCNVTFELVEDFTYRQSFMTVSCPCGTFLIRGIGGQKRFIIDPSPAMVFYANRDETVDLITLQGTILGLEDVVLTGEEHIVHNDVGSCKSAIGLLGNSAAHVFYNTDMNFYVANNNNEICIRHNNPIFRGSLWFHDYWNNELAIKFFLEEDDVYKSEFTIASPFFFVESTHGKSRLIFDEPYLKINLQHADAFVVGQHSYIDGNQVEITTNPIKQTATSFVMGPGLSLTSEDTNVIESNIVRFPFFREKPEIIFNDITPDDYKDQAVSYLLEQGENPVNVFHSVRENFFTKTNYTENILDLGPRSFNTVPIDIDLYVRYGSLSLLQAKGSVAVRQGSVTSFGINSSDILNLVLDDDACIVQGDSDITLKEEDTIYVIGSVCKITVNKKFTINGTLDLNRNTYLIFEFDNSEEEPELIINSSLEIPSGAQLEFRGKGKVFFDDGITIDCFDTSAANLVFRNSARLEIGEENAVTIKGKVNILVDNEAEIVIDSEQQLVFGDQTTDEINIVVNRKGKIRVAAMQDEEVVASSVPLRKAKLSMQIAEYSISVDKNSSIYIGNGGALEINAKDNVEQSGVLRTFEIGEESEFSIGSGGVFVLGLNRFVIPRQTPPLISFDSLNGSVEAGGFVQLAGTEFIGSLYNEVSFQENLTGANLVKKLVNQISQLTINTMFVNDSGNKKLRTQEGIIIDLEPDDIVQGEDASSGIVYIKNNEEFITIDSLGVRE